MPAAPPRKRGADFDGGAEMVVPLLRKDTFRVEKLAGIVPVPVAAMMAGSAWWRSHSIVSPSDLWPSSRVSWKTRAAHKAGMRMRRPRPSTLVWRSLEGFLTALLTVELLLLSSLVTAAAAAVVVRAEEEDEGEEEWAKFLDCWMDMEPMNGPWGGAGPDPEPGSG